MIDRRVMCNLHASIFSVKTAALTELSFNIKIRKTGTISEPLIAMSSADADITSLQLGYGLGSKLCRALCVDYSDLWRKEPVFLSVYMVTGRIHEQLHRL